MDTYFVLSKPKFQICYGAFRKEDAANQRVTDLKLDGIDATVLPIERDMPIEIELFGNSESLETDNSEPESTES